MRVSCSVVLKVNLQRYHSETHHRGNTHPTYVQCFIARSAEPRGEDPDNVLDVGLLAVLHPITLASASVTEVDSTIGAYMTVREEEQIGIRRLAQVVRRVRQIFELPSGLPPEGGRVAAHEERPKRLRRPREVHDVTRM